ncbi:Hypothetical predicted protein, partial [Drosophila guanche]
MDGTTQSFVLTLHYPIPYGEATAPASSFGEIDHARVGIGEGAPKGGSRTAFQIRVTDSLSFFKIDSSTNELPLSDIDFSLNPGTPQCGPSTHKRLHVLTMGRMESYDEPDDLQSGREVPQHLQHLPQISPMATNERPLSCNCTSSSALALHAQAHSHSKSLMDLGQTVSSSEVAHSTGTGNERADALEVGGSSFDDDFQLSSSAPACLMTVPYGRRPSDPTALSPMSHATTSPTASTLRLCKRMEETHPTKAPIALVDSSVSSGGHRKATSHSCGQLSVMPSSAMVLPENPFRFAACSVAAPPGGCFVSCFEPIAENVTQNLNPIPTPTPDPEPEPIAAVS